MLSEPVARMTSPAATSEAALSQDISTDETYPQQTVRVKKRNVSAEPVDVTKIVRAVKRCCIGLSDIEPLRIAAKTISGFYDGTTTRELDQLSIQTAAALVEEPHYAKLAARLLQPVYGLCRTARVMTWAAVAVLGWVIIPR